MKQFINKPFQNQDKLLNYDYGHQVIEEFLKLNNLLLPDIVFDEKLDSRGCFESNRYGYCRVYINLNKCKKPVSVPGFSWSYTGSRADLTPAGVLAHEIGHFIDWKSRWLLSKDFDWKSTKAVSSYEPNELESFAETMRLFILNPDLLKQSIPDRYNYIVKELQLKPIITDSFEEILYNSHEKSRIP